MSTSEYQQRISEMVGALKQQAPAIALRMGQTGLSLVKERSIRDGIQVDGVYQEYSDTKIPKKFFKGKALNAAGDAYSSSGGKGTYEEFKRVQGRGSKHVNAFYSGRMWTALRIVSQTQNGYRYSVLVGMTDPAELEVLVKNLTKYGNFLTLTKAEEETILRDAQDDVQAIVNQYL
jgi:hypothetical protein